MKTATEITANAIYKLTSKVDGKICYAVPSDSTPGHFYKTCWNAETSCWECECKHGEWAARAGRSANCKHAKAAQTSILANKPVVADEEEAWQPFRQRDEVHGTLNGSSAGFSLLK